MDGRTNLRWRIANAERETRPPYLNPENEQVLLPGWHRTTINDALREVWHAAFREVLDILDDVEAAKEERND